MNPALFLRLDVLLHLLEVMMSFTNHKLFTELAYRYQNRTGGYTRMLRTRIRVGDAAPMAYIEFVDRENELRQSKPPNRQPPQRAPLDPWTRSKLSRQFAPPKEEKVSDSDI